MTEEDRAVRQAILVVGALDAGHAGGPAGTEAWKRAAYSEDCGAARGRCLYAPDGPGEESTASAANQASERVAQLVKLFSGTMERYDGPQAAQRLLDTAILMENSPSGTSAPCTAGMRAKKCRGEPDDETRLPEATGNGRIDIDCAARHCEEADGPMTTMGPDGRSLQVSGSALQVAPAFGDSGVRLRRALSRAIGVAEKSGYAFNHVLHRSVGAASVQTTESMLFAPPRPARAGVGFALADGAARIALATGTAPHPGPDPQGRAAPGLFASGAPARDVTRLLGDAIEFSLAWSRGASGRARARSLWLAHSDSSIARRLHAAPGRAAEGEGRRLLRIGGSEPLGRESWVRWELALLDESRTVLGGRNAGALGSDAGAKTRMARLALDAPLGKGRWRGRAELTTASTRAEGGGLIVAWETPRLAGWALEATRHMRAPRTRRIQRTGIRLSQPLRATGGRLLLDYPVRLLSDGKTLERERRAISLAPSGRELRLEAVRREEIGDGIAMESRLLLRRHPGHDPDAANEAAASVGLRASF